MVITAELYDFDKKGALEGWADACLDALPLGFQGYRTAGGFRAVTLRATPFIVKDAESWAAWSTYHAGRAAALGALIGADPDGATDDPGRLFRLPDVVREDGKPCYPELVGTLGVSDLAPRPVPPRKASELYDGDAGLSLCGAVFKAAGRVTRQDGSKLVVDCPWIHEHSSPGGTFVDDTEDHLGKFHCGHTHCKGRHTADAIAALQGIPAVAAEIAHWPTPTGLLEPYQRVKSPVVDAPAVSRDALWLSWSEIMKPLPVLDWLSRDLQLCPGRPAALVAEPNAGKTWALQAMALSIATGEPIFERFHVARPGPVLHVSTDAGEYATRWRYHMLSKGMGLDGRDIPIRVWPGRLKCVTKKGDFDPKGLDPIREEAERGGYRLVILDSLFAIAAGLDMMAPEAAEPLWASKNLSGVWLWAMHTPRGKPGFFGSQAIGAACGVMWNLSAVEKGPRTWTLGRRAEEYQGASLETFRTDWQKDVNEVGDLISGKVVALPDEPSPEAECSVIQRIQYDMLRLLHTRGRASYSELMAEGEAPSGVKGRARQRAAAIINALARPSGGLIVSVEGSNYLPAPGTVMPRAPHWMEEIVRDKDI
jgi:hypothetical protein